MTDPTGEARPGFFPELWELERDAAVLAGKLRAAEAAAAEASGRDPSEQVRVVLGALGRITAVEVGSRWRSRIRRGDLRAAVLAAHQEAGSRRVETWAAEIGRTDVNPEVYAVSPAPSAAPAVGPADESIRRLWSLLQEATDRLDDVAREAAARSQATVTGRSADGHVVAAFTGSGELTDLSVDEAWLTGAGEREIGTALTAAITDGYAVVDRLAQESTSQWPFPDLDRLSGSPAALLATLGLPHDEQRRG